MEWHYGAFDQDCNTVCNLAGGLACDANAMATHSRTAECVTALAANLGVTCNQGGSTSWAGRPAYGSNGNCYYATSGASLSCAEGNANNARFCPCS